MILVVLWLLLIGVLLYVINVYAGPYIAKPILTIINIFVVICVVAWILGLFGILDIPIPQIRR